MTKGGDKGDHHFLKFFLFPENLHLLSLPEDILEVLSVFNVFANYPNPERVVHGLIEEIAEELDNIGVVLGLEKLHCFFL